jgi:hypothetical protein
LIQFMILFYFFKIGYLGRFLDYYQIVGFEVGQFSLKSDLNPNSFQNRLKY